MTNLPILVMDNLLTILNNFNFWNDLFWKCLFYLHFIQIDLKRGSLVCTGSRNKHIIGGLIANENYFVDVFGVHKNVPGLIFKLSSTSFVFNCTKPIELGEDQTEFGRISDFDKRSTFAFKVNSGLFVAFSFIFICDFRFQLQPYIVQNVARVILLIIPLDHPITMKVSSLKKLKKLVDITSAIVFKFKFNNMTEGDRLMLKFSPTGECHQKSKAAAKTFDFLELSMKIVFVFFREFQNSCDHHVKILELSDAAIRHERSRSHFIEYMH